MNWKSLVAAVLLSIAMPAAAFWGSGKPTADTGQKPGEKPKVLVMERVWEPKEKAFSFLVPKGWKISGGIFNVNPMKMNGPGNSISPKCDLISKKDDAGTVLMRMVPLWNYADLSYSATAGMYPPGSQYQGMPVKRMPSARNFLLELVKTSHPRISDPSVVAEVPLPEVVQAYGKKAAGMNAQLRQIGVAPIRFESLALLVEYTEDGVRYREGLQTTIVDMRQSAFQWSNEDTLMFRAPAGEYETWKPVFDSIRMSVEMNPQWVAAVSRAQGERAKMAWETQQYIAKVSREIVENRQKTHAAIRHENWLLITGQEEYRNPFTGKAERDTSNYRHRWVSKKGDTIYTDENAFDPNDIEQYKTNEWKRTPVTHR